MSNQLHIVEETIGYRFKNFDLLQQAFTRRSYSQENGGQNNEVLEFVGDKALDLAVIRILTERFGVMTEDKKWREFKLSNPQYFKTKTKEGIFTDIKRDLVEKKSLARAMDDLGFNSLLFMGKGDISQGVHNQDSVKEDLFEAIVGAVAVDSNFNMDIITKVVETMLDFDAYFDNEDFDDNFVGKVQEWCQANGLGLPNYTYSQNYMWGSEGFVCSVTMNLSNGYYGRTFRGQGTSRAKARMACAEDVYNYLKSQGMIENECLAAVGEPSETDALRQVNELTQKGLIPVPEYKFDQREDDYGESYWRCEAYLKDNEYYFIGEARTKKEAQRLSAYHLLRNVMELDED